MEPVQTALIIHQYLIPGAQVGAKVLTDGATGDLIDVFSVYRPVTPDQGCLWCNGLIDTAASRQKHSTSRNAEHSST